MSDDLLERIRLQGAVPAHIAIIMDGNGRWARERSLPRPLGHAAGMAAVREAIEGCLDAEVGVLTLFAFSQENWQRPADEIEALMQLLEEYIAKEVAELRSRGARVHVLGDVSRLQSSARAALDRIVNETAGGTALDLNLCISYSSRAEPDLLIRTSGEMRISNFLLWQLAYAELYVAPVLWPDFTRRDLFEAILAFQGRDRRFGRVSV